MKPLCFVLMPFGIKPDGSGRTINFDQVYQAIIKPAIDQAGLEPIRADEEGVGGSIHKPMFERLMLCEYAVADLTTGNANVFYELGIRHAFRPRSTTIIFHEGSVLPFDVAPLSGIPYRIDAADRAIGILRERLIKCRAPHDDSPIFQLLDGVPRIEIDHSKVDVFRERVEYSKRYKGRLTQARALGQERGRKEILSIRDELGDLSTIETGLVVDLYLSLRAVKAYADMASLYAEMPVPLQRTRMIREQHAFGLNRQAEDNPTLRNEAERILLEIIRDLGPSSETNGLLGRIYKDQFDEAQQKGSAIAARGFLKKAIDAYLQGFETDWRDAYPGVNAVTLMERLDPPDPRQARLLPVVRYAAERHTADTGGDYWDHATLLELAVLSRDQDAAITHLADAVVQAKNPEKRELFGPETTARNLCLIADWRKARGEDQRWVREIISELARVAEELQKGR